jgi:FlaA1/EpsC-like NDP-sugar epimerase
MPGWFTALRRWRYPISAVVDASLWFVALYLAALARLSFEPSAISTLDYLIVAGVAASAQLLGGGLTGLYRGRRTIASFGEVILVVSTSLIAGTAALATVLIAGSPSLVPISAVLAATAYQMLGALGLRYLARSLVEGWSRSNHARDRRLIVFGAGDAGQQIVRAIQRDPHTDLDVVGILDDNPTKRRLKVHGVPVLGDRSAIWRVAGQRNADTLLIALPSAPQQVINDLADLSLAAGLGVKILPSVHDLTSGRVRVADIRDIEMADFLSRGEVDIDTTSVRNYIAGRRVLVTGAGGSIGAELCRSLLDFGPSQVVMLDHDENALHALQLSIEGRALLDSDDLVLCDIRDEAAVRTAFEIVEPHVVFHAAAHKHVTFLERFPTEGYKTNVEGTRNVLEAACSVGVETFVNISTDKAADPINTLGRTKREAEILTSAMNGTRDGRYMSVRFGNVLGSNGSVIPTFVEQIERDEPITVTDPEATRFFMTIREAVLLTIQAGALGEGGDILVLDMGDPVRIDDLAVRLSRRLRPGAEPKIVYTGLRPGEKLHEVLVSGDDESLPQPHPRIERFRVAPVELGAGSPPAIR